MKKTITILVLSIFILSCKKDNSITLGLVVSTLNNPFFVTMKEGAEKAVQGYTDKKINLIVLDSQNDPAKEASNVEDLITRDIKVLLINPTDSSAVVNSIKRANSANIPVITLDRGSEGGEIATHIASDNIAGGEMAAQYIIEKLNNEGNVVELQGIPGTSAARDRGEGFNRAIQDSNLKVVAQQPANFDRSQGLSVMENILQSQEQINAVFAHNDEMALGAIKAIGASNRKIMVVGFDAIDDAVKSVDEGILSATVAQQPELIGSKGVEYALKALNKEELPKFIPISLKLIKKS